MTNVLSGIPQANIRVFVIWEHVLATDWAAPADMVLSRIPDRRAVQFWDPERLVSRQMGEQEGSRHSIVWDYVAIYPPDAQWGESPPRPAYQGRPVADVEWKLAAKLREFLPR